MRLTLGIGLSNRSGTSEAPAGPTISASGSIDVSTFKIGTTQTITAGTASASGGGTVSYEFRHLANGEVKATTAAYAHVAIDDTEAGVAQWRAVETGGTNPGETSWQTVASGTITRVAPANTVAPVVSGSTSLGDVLSVTQGTWTGDALSYSYQWQRNNVDISGETGTTYTIAQADDAAAIRCVVTASNSGGDVSANSNAVTVDDFAVPSITGVPTIGGTAEVGQTLTATAASVTGNPTPSRTWQWERSGAPISGATSSTYTLVAADDGDTITVVQAETNAIGSDNAESAATATVTYTAPTAGGGLADQSFTEDTGAQTYATAGDFTGDNLTYSLTTSVSGVTINSGTGVVSFNTDTMAVQSGTSIVVQATNSGGSVTSGFSLAITAASSAVNPSVSSDSYTAPASGNAANFDVTGSYSGADTLDLYAVVGTSPITVSEAQLIAGSGGTNTIEFFNIQGFSFASGDFDITGLTSASESANQLRYVIVERNNGGTTGVLTASDTISGLDFTAPAFSSAEVGNVNASTLRATFNSALYKSTVAGDWALIGNTISAVSFTPGNNYIDFTLGTAATASDDYTGDLSYSGTSLTDVADNSLATFSGQDVTNNVSGGVTPDFETDFTALADGNLSARPDWNLFAGPATGNQISSGELIYTSTAAYCSPDITAPANVAVEIDFTVDAVGSDSYLLLVAGRVTDTDNYYGVGINFNGTGQLVFFEGNFGTWASPITFATAGITVGTEHTIRIEMDGTTITAFVDGNQVQTATDTTQTSGDVMTGLPYSPIPIPGGATGFRVFFL